MEGNLQVKAPSCDHKYSKYFTDSQILNTFQNNCPFKCGIQYKYQIEMGNVLKSRSLISY